MSVGATNNAATLPNTGTQPAANAQPVAGAQPAANAAAANTNATAAANGQVRVGSEQTQYIIHSLFQQPYSIGNGIFGNQSRSLSSAISEIARVSDDRQRRLKDIYLAIAADAQATGQYNQYALQQAQRLTTLEEHSSSLMKSVFDKLNNAIAAWVRN